MNDYKPTRFMLPSSHYDEKKADRAVGFIKLLPHTIGQWEGKPFELLPWQEQIIRDVFGIVKENGYRQFRQVYVELGKKNGKALALDTPIPTPSGWTTMGAIKVGDKIFGKDGKAYSVTFATDVMTGHKCYKVTFSDGSEIIADADHLWQVNSWFLNPGSKTHGKGYKFKSEEEKKQDRYKSSHLQVLNTEALRKTLKMPGNIGNNHSIDLASPIKCKIKKLPIPPYTFGVWLGDGNSSDAGICVTERDIEILDIIRNEGVPLRQRKDDKGIHYFGLTDGCGNRWNDNYTKRLRSLGVIGNKHIPDIYLRASEAQRWALLRGLMDTDGFCSTSGQCEFSTVNKAICDGFMELVQSLGIKATCKESRANLYGKDCGAKFRISFYSYKSAPCFLLKRKAERLKDYAKTRSGVRKIVSIDPVESVPVRCIQVDSPDHLYLAGRSFIPTHNTELDAAIALKLLCADDEPAAEIYGCATDRQQASICYNVAAKMVKLQPLLRKKIKLIESQKRMIYLPNGSFYQVLSSEAYSKHGFNVHGLIFDELHAMPDRKLFDVMTKGSGDARRQPLFFYTTTAGNDTHTICYEQHQKALDIIEGRKIDPTFYPVMYSASEDDDWTSPETWKKANPSLGITIDIDRVREACESAQQNPAEENAFRQLRLSQWVKQTVRWMPMNKWNLCDGEVNPAELEGRVCYGGLDLSSSGDITAFVLVFPPKEEDGIYHVMPFFWIPEENIELRVKRDHVPYDVWNAQNLFNVTEGNVIHYSFIEKFIEELGKHYNIREIAFDRWGATQMTQDLEEMGFTVVPFGQGFRDMSPPTKELMNLVLQRRIAHGGNPVLSWMVDNVSVKQDSAGNIKMDKEKSTEKIDGAVALVMALDRAIRNGYDESTSVYDERGVIFI